jgi:geranylgeranyl diphosphate synthase, type II
MAEGPTCLRKNVAGAEPKIGAAVLALRRFLCVNRGVTVISDLRTKAARAPKATAPQTDGAIDRRTASGIDGFEAARCKAAVDERLAVLLAAHPDDPPRLRQAMRHAALSPGKRFRPVLTLLAARQCGVTDWRALDAACAIEMVHAASLILDDLPCMDDAALRRGQPTTHRVFGEDIAILAAVGLLNEAYAVIAASEGLEPASKAGLCRILAATVGAAGLLGGQEFDLRDRRSATDSATIARFNHAKTGVLMVGAVDFGAVIAGADAETRRGFAAFARHIGEAFQMADDIIDATGATAEAGKDVGKDFGREATVITLFGARGAREAVHAHLERGCAELAATRYGADPLAQFARASFAEQLLAQTAPS